MIGGKPDNPRAAQSQPFLKERVDCVVVIADQVGRWCRPPGETFRYPSSVAWALGYEKRTGYFGVSRGALSVKRRDRQLGADRCCAVDVFSHSAVYQGHRTTEGSATFPLRRDECGNEDQVANTGEAGDD